MIGGALTDGYEHDHLGVCRWRGITPRPDRAQKAEWEEMNWLFIVIIVVFMTFLLFVLLGFWGKLVDYFWYRRD